MILLPEDPDGSAHRIRVRLQANFGIDLPVIVSDTFERPWRRGLTDIAIGVSGLEAVIDPKGTNDWAGREFEVTEPPSPTSRCCGRSRHGEGGWDPRRH